MITGFEASHAVADRLDDSGSLVTAHHGEGCVGEVAHSDVLVGVAQPGETHLDEHLLRAGVVDLELLDLPRGVDFVGDGGTCLHGAEARWGSVPVSHQWGRTTTWTQ